MPTLIEALRAPTTFGRGALYAARATLAPDAPCLVLDPDAVDDPDEDPPAARAAGVGYLMSMDDVDGIARNLAAQVADPPDTLRWQAFLHYLERDAFLVLPPGAWGPDPLLPEPHRRRVVDAMLGRLSRDALRQDWPSLDRDPLAFVIAGVARADAERDGDALESLLALERWFCDERALVAPTLARLLDADWHARHEDLASRLQGLQDPRTVPALLRTARRVPPAFAWDENRALAVKCVWALHDIGTPEAKAALAELADDPDPIVAERAAKRLAGFDTERARQGRLARRAPPTRAAGEP